MSIKSMVLLGFCALLLSSCHNKSTYKDEDLLFRYIDERQSDLSDEDSFVFITYRRHVVCASCLPKFPLEELIDTAMYLYPSKPVYVLTDDSAGTYLLFPKYKQLKKIILEETLIMQQYGFYNNYPKIFEIEGSCIISWHNIGTDTPR